MELECYNIIPLSMQLCILLPLNNNYFQKINKSLLALEEMMDAYSCNLSRYEMIASHITCYYLCQKNNTYQESKVKTIYNINKMSLQSLEEIIFDIYFGNSPNDKVLWQEMLTNSFYNEDTSWKSYWIGNKDTTINNKNLFFIQNGIPPIVRIQDIMEEKLKQNKEENDDINNQRLLYYASLPITIMIVLYILDVIHHTKENEIKMVIDVLKLYNYELINLSPPPENDNRACKLTNFINKEKKISYLSLLLKENMLSAKKYTIPFKFVRILDILYPVYKILQNNITNDNINVNIKYDPLKSILKFTPEDLFI